MIFLLKSLLIILFLFCSGILYFVYGQYKTFLKSNESEGLSIINKMFIGFVLILVVTFVVSIMISSGYFVFQTITI